MIVDLLSKNKQTTTNGRSIDNREPLVVEISFVFSFRLTCLRFQDPVTKKRYEAKVVLQVRIRPDSYRVGPQTIGAAAEIDPKFSNQEIEWFTKERGSIKIYGLLVRMDEIKE